MTFLALNTNGQTSKTLTDRFQCANLSVPDIEKTSFVRFINDYIIIQEYFQESDFNSGNTVGRNVFINIITHLNASSRGQIHAHMLGNS
jgi:hypothetical protein